MLDYVNRFIARRSFMKARSRIYETLYDQLVDTGSKRIETFKDVFEAWHKRDEARKLEIAQVYHAVAQRLKGGKPFSKAIGPFIPMEEALLLDAGEASGRLPDALQACLTSLRAHDEMRGAISGQMAQPMFGFFGLIVSSAVMGSMLWPDLLQMFKEENWPSWALALVLSHIWIAQNWFAVSILGVMIGLYYYTLPRWTGKLRHYFDMIPPWSVYRDKTASSVLIVLAGLIRAGLTVDEAVERMAKGSSPYLTWHLMLIKRRIKAHGSDAIKAFETGLFSRPLLDRIDDAARTRQLADALSAIGERSMHLIVAMVKRSAAVANNVLMLIVGFLFAWSLAAQVLGVQEASERFMAKSQMNKAN